MVTKLTTRQLRAAVPAALAVLLDVPVGDVLVQRGTGAALDLLVTAAGHAFAVEVLGNASPGALAAQAAQVVSAARRQRRKAVPLLAVPFMSEAGRRVCQEAKVAWFDLSGNAHIVATGMRVIVDGRPNRFRGPGRPASIFAPKSARVARWLLVNEDRSLTQRNLSTILGNAKAAISGETVPLG